MLDPCVTPADRVTKNRVNAYLAELRQVNAGFTIPDRIQELGDAMRALAPHEDWSWMLRAAGRLRAITIPAKDKRARIRPIDELVQLGLSLMAEAEQNGSLTKLQRALAFRDGLLIAFLSFHPIRLKNLSTLEYGRHVTARGNRFWLSIAANEMKNRRPFECEIAERLIEPIRRYLEHYRPLLLGRHAGTHPSAFWVSGNGSRLCAGRIQTIVRRRTGDVGMLPISPHLFRSCAATAVAINRPELVDIIPGVLSHATRKTSEESYNMAGMIEASRAHADLIGQLGQNE
ncbi:MAG: hypothetical protein JO188_07965 [Hyphomicrobiales bacterium]|nr:hypothetical protein [Hyphomicrobiales bacterium]